MHRYKEGRQQKRSEHARKKPLDAYITSMRGDNTRGKSRQPQRHLEAYMPKQEGREQRESNKALQAFGRIHPNDDGGDKKESKSRHI